MTQKPPLDSLGFLTGRIAAPSAAPYEGVPPELARQIEESIEDLRHDRTEDTGAFLERMRVKIVAARNAARKRKRPSR